MADGLIIDTTFAPFLTGGAQKAILPDSRLSRRPDFGTTMMEWSLPSGVVKVEVVPIFCASCGKHAGYCPRENTTFLFYQCNQCFEKYGLIPGTYAMPDDEFCQAVAHEMDAAFGRHLTDFEVNVLSERSELPPALAALEKDSIFPCKNKRPINVP